jgi:tRNA threonylcarbamoyladenosine biosynthesis protein TsaE
MLSGRFHLPDDAATAALGAGLAAELTPGDVVLLQGPLGAGKTALARAMLRALAGDEDLEVPSPSFALVQPYTIGARSVLHADLYRLADGREVAELGLLEDPDSIVLVEWPERAPDLARYATLKVTLSVPTDGDSRIAEVVR